MSAALPVLAGTDLTEGLSAFEELVSGKILIWVLLGAGLYLTIRTRGVQMRLFSRPSSSGWEDAWEPAISRVSRSR